MVGLVIIGALFFQSIVGQFSRLLAAFVGYAITTGVLIWGLSVYAESDAFEEQVVTFFGIDLSKPVFVLLCLAWYGYNTWQLVLAFRERQATKELLERYPVLGREGVIQFYGAAFKAWTERTLAAPEPAPQNLEGLQVLDFINRYPPDEGTALGRFFERRQPSGDEAPLGLDTRWYVLTSARLLQRDGRDGRWREVVLADVATHGRGDRRLVFRMKDGEEVVFEHVEAAPTDELLRKALSSREGTAEPERPEGEPAPHAEKVPTNGG